jgi:hypothetical protein
MHYKRLPRRVKKWKKKYCLKGHSKPKWFWAFAEQRGEPKRGKQKIDKITRRWIRRIRKNLN